MTRVGVGREGAAGLSVEGLVLRPLLCAWLGWDNASIRQRMATTTKRSDNPRQWKGVAIADMSECDKDRFGCE